jgi:hypothetical protein
MSRAFILSVLFILIFNGIVLSGPGDTTIVQTFKFSDITKRRGWYVFPSDTMRWHKILMYYTLKCDPATTQDQYPCGEWDYTTYTNLYNYKNLQYPYYINNGLAPDSFLITFSPVYNYFKTYQLYPVYDNTISENDYLTGTGTEALANTLQSSLPENRSQYLWTASELLASGLNSGSIDKIRLDFISAGQEIHQLKIRMKNSALIELTKDSFETDSFTTTFYKNTTIPAAGISNFNFSEPFIWDGSSDIVIDFSFTGNTPGINHVLNGENTGMNSGIYSLSDDGYLSFSQPEYIEVPAQVFANVDSFITISFWQFGDTAIQPANSWIFEGCDSLGQRVINCHLPWSNSNIYWDAGNNAGSSYDRINQAANLSDFAGKWNHWTFTKNVLTGTMKIYLNGHLWLSGTGMTKRMYGITAKF